MPFSCRGWNPFPVSNNLWDISVIYRLCFDLASEFDVRRNVAKIIGNVVAVAMYLG
jgi:hypothetical protein